jgi:hypothetical protein
MEGLMKRLLAAFSLLLMVLPILCAQEQSGLVNFNHLRHLTERIEFLGDSVDIVHVYANYPDYGWVGAAESGLEGVACVDDAGRAAVVYLRHYELTGSEESRNRAVALLKFILKMETPDGKFYNFVLQDHSINTGGKTSFKSFGWWAARGVWSMGLGCRILAPKDSSFAAMLRLGVERTFPNIDSLLAAYGKEKEVRHLRIPGWLFYESGADATSELLLGLNNYFAATKDKRVKGYIEKLARALMTMQEGDLKTFPYGLHRSWETMWHMWGNGQTQALALSGRILKDSTMVESARREAEGWYSRLLIEGFMKELDVADSTKRTGFEQIAYAVRPVAVGLIRLYEATNDPRYLTMSGLAASWLLGNNVLGQPMYDSANGRCFDGIRDSTTLNRNSGAESTIEALATLVEVEQLPLARRYLYYKKVFSRRGSDYIYGLFRNPAGEELTLAIDLKKPELLILEGAKSAEFQEARTHD